jgi:hypothetical protein
MWGISVRRLTILVILAASSGAMAQTSSDRATARALALEGHQALKNGDFAKAENLLGRAYSLVPVPTVGVELARAQVALGKVVSANETYSRILHEPLPASAPPAHARSLDDARKEIETLKSRLPSVVLTVKGPQSAAVSVDGALISSVSLGVPRFMDPGAHTVNATADSFATATAEFLLKEGESKRVELVLVPASPVPAVPSDAALPAVPSVPAVSAVTTDVQNTPPGLAPAARAGASPGDANDGPPGRESGSVRTFVGDAAAGFGLGSLAFGVVSWLEARSLGHGQAATQPQKDTYSRTQTLALTSLAAGGIFAVGGIALHASAGPGASLGKQLGWALVGAGVSGLGFGVATGLMARHVQSQLDAVCQPACPSIQQPNVSSQDTLGTWSAIGFIGGGLAAAGGVVVLVASEKQGPPKETSSQNVVVPYITASAFGLTGSF